MLSWFSVGLLALQLASAEPPPSAWPEAPEARAALLERELIPALQLRAEIARQAVSSREAWWAVGGSRAAAWPELEGRALDDAAVLHGLVAHLDEAATARARERLRSPPPLEDPKLEAKWRAALDDALAAEDAADASTRRLIVALQAFLDTFPEVSAKALAPQREALDTERAELTARLWAVPEGERAGIALAVAAVDADRAALDRWAAALLARATHPASPLPDPASELEVLRTGSAPRAEQAQARLVLARGHLPVEQAQRVAAGLAAWYQERELPRLRERLAELAPGATVPAGSDPVEEAARLREAIAAAEAKAATEAKSASAPAPEVAAELARLEAARAAVAQATDEASAKANAAGERATAAWAQAQAAQEALSAAREAREDEANAWRERAAQAPDTMILRVPGDADDALLALSDAIAVARARVHAAAADARALRAEVASAQARLVDEAARPGELADPALRAAWQEALRTESRALEALPATAQARIDLELDHLRALKLTRRELSPRASRSARARLTDADELVAETALLADHLRSIARARFAALQAAPGLLTDVSALWRLLVGVSKLGLGMLVLLALRGQCSGAAGYLAHRLPSWFPDLHPSDLPGLSTRIARLFTHLVDVAIYALALGILWPHVPELGLVLAFAAGVAGYRSVVSAFRLLFPSVRAAHPGLRVLTDEGHALGLRLTRVLLLWWLSRWFTGLFLRSWLGLDAVHAVVMRAWDLSAVAVAAWTLHRSEPFLRRAVVALPGDGEALARLRRGPPYPFLASLWAVAALSLLSARLGWDLLQRQAQQRDGVGRWFTWLDRMQLTSPKREPLPPLPPGLAGALSSEGGVPEAFLRPSAADVALDAAYQKWVAGRAAGLVVVTGDRGSGLRLWADRLVATWHTCGHAVVRVRLERRLADARAARAFLAQAVGLPPGTSWPALHAHVDALPPTHFVLEDTHLAWLRTVGGLEALRVLAEFAARHSGAHFWTFTLHSGAWSWISRLDEVLEPHLFPTHVALAPMDDKELRAAVQDRLAAAGVPLVSGRSSPRTGMFGADPEVEAERGMLRYFRLIVEVAQGNPSVALALVRQSLRVLDDGAVEAVPEAVLDSPEVDDLSPSDLFVLTALRLQDELDERELIAVTNLPTRAVRAALLDLTGRHLIHIERGRYLIPSAQLPGVTRALRRHHYLQWSF